MPNIPHESVVGSPEDVVQGDGKFHCPQTCTEVTPGLGDYFNQILADVGRQQLQFGNAELPYVFRYIDFIKVWIRMI
jgi:hypothetical protein